MKNGIVLFTGDFHRLERNTLCNNAADEILIQAATTGNDLCGGTLVDLSDSTDLYPWHRWWVVESFSRRAAARRP